MVVERLVSRLRDFDGRMQVVDVLGRSSCRESYQPSRCSGKSGGGREG